MGGLTLTERNLLRAPGQRYRVYLALWGSWQIAQETPLNYDPNTGEPRPTVTVAASAFEPVLVLGPHRLAFAGEPISFDASASWARGGGAAPAGSWNFGAGASPAVASGPGPHAVAWTTPGLKEVSYSSGGAVGRRWVRVLADRREVGLPVITIGGLAGAIDKGWKAEVTVAATLGENDPLPVTDYQAIGLFVEEEWETAAGWARVPIGGQDLGDPRLLFAGYIQQGSIEVSVDGSRIGFTLGGLQEQLAACTIHTISYWGRTQYEIFRELNSDAVASEKPTKGGHILELAKTTVVDVILHLLQTYTNVLERHDFVTWYDISQQDTLNLSGREGDLWGVLGSWLENEFAWLWVDQGMRLHVEPNPHIRSLGAYASAHPIRATLTGDDLLRIAPVEDKTLNVIYVKVTATNPARGKAYVSTHPGQNPASGVGSWLILDNLLVSQKGFLDGIVENLFQDANRRWTASAVLFLNRAFVPGDRIRLTLTLPRYGIAWSNKLFLVRSVSYALELAAGSWLTTLQIEEFV